MASIGPVFPPKLTGQGETKIYGHIKELNAFQ